jgi:beta-galactosidase
MQVADVWLNGQHLHTNYCGYIPFTLDVTKALRHGSPNVLTLRLNNADNPEVPPGKPQNKLDFVYFGGLYRSVDLIVTDPLHITDPILRDQPAGGGIFVTIPSIEVVRATVAIKTESHKSFQRAALMLGSPATLRARWDAGRDQRNVRLA